MKATDLDPLAHPDTPVWGIPPGERPDLIVDRTLLRMMLGSDDRDWGHDNLRLKELHAAGRRGKGVTVAVVDTGLDAAHPDLSAQVVARTDFTGQGPDDGNGHGTHCGGIAAAAENGGGIVGAAPDAKLLGAKVLSNSGSGLSTWIARGIRWAADNGADIISLSLGGPGPDGDTQAAVAYAIAKGCWVVAAAGNDGGPASSYPGNYPGVVCVAATDPQDRRASFSTINPENDVSAPGVNIFSTLPGNRYGRMSGTSMATPYVSGSLACVRGALKAAGKPVPPADELLLAIAATAKDIPPSGRDSGTGWGLLDPVKLLAHLMGPAPTPPSPPPPPSPPVPPPAPADTLRVPAGGTVPTGYVAIAVRV